MTNTLLSRAWMVAAACACAVSAGAQDQGLADVAAGAQSPQQIEAAGAARPGRLTRALDWAETRMNQQPSARDGFYPDLAPAITGAGLAAGVGYRHRLFGDAAVFDTSASISVRRYQTMQSQLTWPGLLGHRLAVGGQVRYQDFTQINFFGVGAASLKDNQTDYRLKDVDTLGFATLRANTWLSITGRAGLLRRLDIARGTSSLYPSAGDLFDETSAPGLTLQPNYAHSDVAMTVDTRDAPGYPSRGARYQLSMAMFHDQDFARYSFRRLEADAEQYVPLGRAVIGLRGRMALSQTGEGQDVPFYLLPTLGGSTSLRGYEDYRFRDRDLLFVGAEYRWPLLRRVDAALFYDAGTVAPTAGGLSQHLRSDYGAGVRLHTAEHMLVRLDVARSPEGTRALISFSAPVARPNGTVVRSVP